MGRQFITDKTGLVNFSLPEFNLKKQISWVFHVDEKWMRSAWIIIGIILNFNDKTVTLDIDTIPMKDRGMLNTQEALVEV
jgi:hypothetical protein